MGVRAIVSRLMAIVPTGIHSGIDGRLDTIRFASMPFEKARFRSQNKRSGAIFIQLFCHKPLK
ncbi:MAG: hypothetical protein EA405_06920 [Rhodospirillales bacterium]|nr:MAG: hypothetical protein EA405_06920 [Rhodospirillales bacterium]